MKLLLLYILIFIILLLLHLGYVVAISSLDIDANGLYLLSAGKRIKLPYDHYRHYTFNYTTIGA